MAQPNFLQSNTATFDTTTDNPTVSLSGSRTVGNLLVASLRTTAVTGDHTPSSDWVQLIDYQHNGSNSIFARIATNTAADTFSTSTSVVASTILTIAEFSNADGWSHLDLSGTPVVGSKFTTTSASNSNVDNPSSAGEYHWSPFDPSNNVLHLLLAVSPYNSPGATPTNSEWTAIQTSISPDATSVFGYRWGSTEDFRFDGTWAFSNVNSSVGLSLPADPPVLVLDDFQYPDTTNLVNTSSWDVDTIISRSGGVMQSDQHSDHSNGQVIDMTSAGYQFAIHSVPLDADDQTAELVFYGDSLGSFNAQHGVLLRTNSPTADLATLTGYNVTVESQASHPTVSISRWNGDGTFTELASWDGVEADPWSTALKKYGQIRLTASIVGSTITAWVDGIEVGSTTDSTYSTGKYVGMLQDRLIGDVYSQVFISHWAAWTDNTTNAAFADVIQSGYYTTDSNPPSETSVEVALSQTPTAGNLLLAFAHWDDSNDDEVPDVQISAGSAWTKHVDQIEATNTHTKALLWSKISDGTESTVRIDNYAVGVASLFVVELPSTYSIEEVVSASSDTVTTSTLSNNPKLLIAGGHHGFGVGGANPGGWSWGRSNSTVTTIERPLAYRNNPGLLGDTRGELTLVAHDIGTDTAAQTVDAEYISGGIATIAVVLAKSQFNPQTDIAWHTLHWAEGTAMSALGYADGADVDPWPDETARGYDAVAVGGVYTTVPKMELSGVGFNGKPYVQSTADTDGLKAPYQLWLDTASGSTVVTFIVVGRIANLSSYGTLVDSSSSASARIKIGFNNAATFWEANYGAGDVTTTHPADTDLHLHTIRRYVTGTDVTHEWYIDGQLIHSQFDASPDPFKGLGLNNYILGAGKDGRAELAFCGVYDGDLTILPVYNDILNWAGDHYGLTITAPAEITDYIVEYRTTSGPGAWQVFGDSVSPTTGVTVTGLTPGASYDFRVAAVNSSGIGLWSNIATVTAGSAGTVNIRFGDSTVVGLALGDSSVTAAYLGDTQIL